MRLNIVVDLRGGFSFCLMSVSYNGCKSGKVSEGVERHVPPDSPRYPSASNHPY